MRTYLEFRFNTNPKETRGADCLYFLYLEDAFHSNICRNSTVCFSNRCCFVLCVERILDEDFACVLWRNRNSRALKVSFTTKYFIRECLMNYRCSIFYILLFSQTYKNYIISTFCEFSHKLNNPYFSIGQRHFHLYTS